MSSLTIGIPIAFSLIAILLLWFIIGSKGHWSIKFIAIPFTLFFSLVIWNSINYLTGWPCNDPLPEKYLLHWAVVKENRDIYILVEETNAKDQDLVFLPNDFKKQPRLYRLDYNREIHKQLEESRKKIKQGERIIGGGGQVNGKLNLRELPKATLPPKKINNPLTESEPLMPALPKFE